MKLKERLNAWARSGNSDTMIKQIVYSWTRKNCLAEFHEERDSTMYPNTIVCDRPITLGAWKQKYKRVSMRFMYKFLKPLLFLCKKFLGPYLSKDVKEADYNKPILAFDSAIEKSLKDWNWYYQVKEDDRKNRKYGDYTDTKYGMHNIVRMIKRIIITLIQTDSAYRELFNIMIFNLAIQVNKDFPEHHKHLMYVDKTIDSVKYFQIAGTLNHAIMTQLPDGNYVAIDPQYATVIKELPAGYSKYTPIKVPKEGKT